MPTNPQKKAEQMARAERIFNRHVIDLTPLSQLAPEEGISVETARKDFKAYKSFLASENREDLPGLRAQRIAELNDLKAKALYLFDRYKDSKPLTAVGALNSAVAVYAHIRAIEGLDAPKESRVEAEVNYNVTWGDPNDVPTSEPDTIPAPGLEILQMRRT